MADKQTRPVTFTEGQYSKGGINPPRTGTARPPDPQGSGGPSAQANNAAKNTGGNTGDAKSGN